MKFAPVPILSMLRPCKYVVQAQMKWYGCLFCPSVLIQVSSANVGTPQEVQGTSLGLVRGGSN